MTDPGPAESWIPPGAQVRLNKHARFLSKNVLMGGSPSRVLTLTHRADKLLADAGLTVTDDLSKRLAEQLTETGIADPVPETLPGQDTTQITVVVPTYQRSLQLKRLLSSVKFCLPNSPVIVVDDASGSESKGIVQQAEAHGARYILLEQNSGPGEARNAGLAEISTEFVLFVDTDVVLQKDGIDLLLRHFADPRLAAAAPRVLSLPGYGGGWITDYEGARSSLDHGPDAGLVRPHSPLSWISTTCLLMRTQAARIGFSPGMRVAEDVDLVWRLHSTEWRVRYEPSSTVYHEHRSTAQEWFTRKFIYGTGAADLAQRHGNLVAPAVLAPWAGAVLICVAVQRRWSLTAAAVLTGWAYTSMVWKLRSLSLARQQRLLLASRLISFGLLTAAGQGVALTVRHWIPGVVVGSLFSKRARRLLLLSTAIDTAWEYVRLKPEMSLAKFAAARRLDDLAYSLGVWKSALCSGSPRTALRTLAPTRPMCRR
ncbi:mycofactocin biosynthesis glycosyltransferase MftF [Nesterenkonia alkaliphila]|uniref:Mycofactocin system glycosyltransferase n=1 Tax=Nesterenkonia alkaliphila TaxID=1463631 RepID=A0A7K1UFM0_9MICC|nr:mycofactocin biosynthesis glycosyltransferase MftF [Nesterenkonia alkaliphila]MVT25184.1 mycofactocin system glycosyltransferase [Nesterenkonia alkaliphila]GFZ93715.1 putative glycosyltransferase [Nesterenkonia alkaliphila]